MKKENFSFQIFILRQFKHKHGLIHACRIDNEQENVKSYDFLLFICKIPTQQNHGLIHAFGDDHENNFFKYILT